MADDQYEYTPLSTSTTQIRLLKIQSISGPTVRCSLDLYDLADIEGQYYTLSYVWGDQNFTDTILCDGKKLSLTPSLEKTVRELFKYQVSTWDPSEVSKLSVSDDHGEGTKLEDSGEDGEESKEESSDEDEDECFNDEFDLQKLETAPGDCLFWIDAICLNQKDPLEIAIQIPLMGKIYSFSHTTFAYLGPAADGSDLVLSEIRQLNRNVNRLAMSQNSDPALREVVGYESDPGIRPGLSFLVERPYFGRVWIMQEAIVAKRIMLGCGDLWISGSLFFQTFSVLLGTAIAGLWISTEIRDFTRIILPLQFLGLRREGKAKTTSQILKTLGISRSRGCKEPADHIWGVFGLFDPDVQDSIMTHLDDVELLSSKTTDWSEVFIRFAKWCLKVDGKLSLLVFAPSKTRPDNLPSWCPNWNSEMPYNPEDAEFYKTGQTKSGRESSEPREIRFKVLPDSNKLQLSGFRIDTIQTLIGASPKTSKGSIVGDYAKEAGSILEWEQRCLDLSRTTFNTEDDSVPEAHWRTLVTNQLPGIDGKPVPEEPDYERWKEMISRSARSDSEGLDPNFAANLTRYVQYNGAFVWASEKRIFMSTKGGRVGWAPPGAREGDVICVFYGGGPLFVIRFEEGGTEAKLVGDAYVHGLMRVDEALESADRGVDEDFILI